MVYNPFSLSGKTILVTGASSGIGREIAIECSKMGAKLIITARNIDNLNHTKSLLTGEGHHIIGSNLVNYNSILTLTNEIDKLDGVVFCAGIVKPLMVKIAEKQDIDDVFSINALSPIYLSHLLVQEKKLNKGASLVYISSISGVNCGYIGGSVYGSTKGALQGFIKGAALELAPRGIRLNCINPGMIETKLLNESNISQEQLDSDKLKYPLKRYGTPQEVALSAIYLLSEATKWMTGSSILLDGGYTLN